MAGTVVVVGSLSQDLVVKSPRLPVRGETIRGTDFGMFVGGKGNNQALAAARAGASVAMVGRVGDDSFGTTIIDTLVRTGVDAQRVIRDPSVGSGIAIIIVGGDGDNSIVIAQQANLQLSPTDVENARALIESADIVLLQMEVPLETNIAAAKLAHTAGVPVALNPAPAPEDGKLPDELLRHLAFITPNQTETLLLTGIEVRDVPTAMEAGAALVAMGPKAAIVTMGEQGALLWEQIADLPSGAFVQTPRVDAIDTTAAGDAFCGAFAAAFARKTSVMECLQFACTAGALACTKLGAEPSLPQLKEIEQLIASTYIANRI